MDVKFCEGQLEVEGRRHDGLRNVDAVVEPKKILGVLEPGFDVTQVEMPILAAEKDSRNLTRLNIKVFNVETSKPE